MPRLHSFLPLAAAVALASGIASSANTTPSMPGTLSGERTANLSARLEDRSNGPGIMSNVDESRHAAWLERNTRGAASATDLLHDTNARDTHQVNWGGVIRIGR